MRKRTFSPSLDCLETRSQPAVLDLGSVGYVSADSSSYFDHPEQNRWNVQSSSNLVIYTKSQAFGVVYANTAEVDFVGIHISATAPNLWIYSTGGSLVWIGGHGAVSVVQVSQKYTSFRGQDYVVSLCGMDQISVHAGDSDKNTFDFYGTKYPERLTFLDQSSFYLTHRDGADSFFGFPRAVFRGGGGADAFFGVKPTQYVAIGFRSGRELASMTIQDLYRLTNPSIQTDSYQLAESIRDFVTNSVPIGINSSSWLAMTPQERFLSSYVYRTEPVICGGAGILYRDLCAAFGLKCRIVYLWDANLENSHVANEVYISGKWQSMDPTYNFSAVDLGGNVLSFEEMAVTEWKFFHNGFSGRWRFNYLVYPFPYSNYLAHIVYNTKIPAK